MSRLQLPKPLDWRCEYQGRICTLTIRYVSGCALGSDVQLAALLALGLRGIEKKLAIKVPPLDGTASADVAGERLPKTLAVATERFMAKSSLAREVLGDDFVDHFGGTRQHELRQFEEAVTDWELERYLELA